MSHGRQKLNTTVCPVVISCHARLDAFVVQHVPFLLRTSDLPAFSTPAFSAPTIIYLLLKCDAILKAETNPGHEECGMGCSRAESGRTVYVMEIQKQHDSNELKRQGRRCSA